MEAIHHNEVASTTTTKPVTTDALDVAVKGIGTLVTLLNECGCEVPHVVAVQITKAREYIDLLTAQPETSAEKDAYIFGVNHGALIAIWRHLQLLGYVADAGIETVPLVKNKEKSNSLKSKR